MGQREKSVSRSHCEGLGRRDIIFGQGWLSESGSALPKEGLRWGRKEPTYKATNRTTIFHNISLLGLFYLCFFGVLFSLFALQMWITLHCISGLDKPYMQHSSQAARAVYNTGARSFFRAPFAGFSNPGLGFIPNVLTPTTSPIIWVSELTEKSKPKNYIGAIGKFLKGYERNETLYDHDCVDGRLPRRFGRKPCFFDTKTLGQCSIAPYGYARPYQPCVLVKFNKRFDWVPIYYNQTSELPERMPLKLRNTVRASEEFRVWLSCTGASNVDKEHIGEIDYLPAPGFPVQYFPFTGQRDYMSPVVALVFKNLTTNRLVTVECTVWAQNMRHDQRYCLDFQIMIGEK